MLTIQNKTISRLRDRLKERGERPSLFAADITAIMAAKEGDVPADILLRFDSIKSRAIPSAARFVSSRMAAFVPITSRR